VGKMMYRLTNKNGCIEDFDELEDVFEHGLESGLELVIEKTKWYAHGGDSDVILWDGDGAVLLVALAGTGDIVDLRGKVEDERRPAGWREEEGIDVCSRCGEAYYVRDGCSNCDGRGRIAPVKRRLEFEDFSKENGTDFTTPGLPALAPVSAFLCDDCGQETFDCCCKREGESEDGADIPFRSTASQKTTTGGGNNPSPVCF
jgi:hypothetical protein